MKKMSKKAKPENEELVTMNPPKAKMESKKKKRIIRLSVIGGIVLLLVGYITVSSIAASKAGIMVKTIQALTGDVESDLSLSGTIKGEFSRTYFSSVNGDIGEVHVKLGDAVKEGDQLVSYNLERVENSLNQQLLTSEASESSYQSALSEHSKNYKQLEKAVNDIIDYQLLMNYQENYIQDLEDSIQDEISKKRVNLYNKQYSIQRELNNAEESSKVEELQNGLTYIQQELAILGDYKTPDNKEKTLIKAKNDLTDMQEGYQEARGKQSGAEAGILNGNKIQEIKTSKEVAQLKIEQATMDLEEARKGIAADFEGIVIDVKAVEGSVATAGTQLVTLESSDNVKVEFTVSKYDLEQLALGQKVDVTISGQQYEGTVSKINRMATPNSSGTPMVSAEVHIDNPDDKIYLGIEAKLLIHVAKSEGVLLVPVETVNADTAGDFCYVVEEGKVARRNVTTGISSDMYIEVKEGLKEGEQVITSAMGEIIEGSVVTVLPEQ